MDELAAADELPATGAAGVALASFLTSRVAGIMGVAS